MYVTALEHNATKTSGEVVVYALNFNGGNLSLVDLDLTTSTTSSSSPFGYSNSANVVYRWSGQDPALNPTIAVNNNLSSFTDPQTGLSHRPTDPLVGTVYVAWNTNATLSSLVPPHPTNANAILTTGSSNGGLNFSTPVIVNDNGYAPGLGATAPQILFTPLELNSQTSANAGQLTFVWSTTSGRVVFDSSTPNDNTPGQPAVNASGYIPVDLSHTVRISARPIRPRPAPAELLFPMSPAGGTSP